MKRANTMSTITVELTIKVKSKFTSSNAERPMDSSHHRCQIFTPPFEMNSIPCIAVTHPDFSTYRPSSTGQYIRMPLAEGLHSDHSSSSTILQTTVVRSCIDPTTLTVSSITKLSTQGSSCIEWHISHFAVHQISGLNVP